MKEVIQKNWDKGIIAVLTLLLFLLIFLPFILYNSLDKYDTPGLLSLSWFIKHYTFPDFQGWNPFFFAGFPQGILYPPLFHYLVAALNHFFSLDLSYKLIITSFGLLIPWSLYLFNRSVYKEKSWSMLSTFFILLTLIVLPGFFGFNFDGVIDYGLGPSFVTIPIFFFYLGSLFKKNGNFKLPAILLSLMVLTNLVATLVAGFITVIYLLMHRKDSSITRRVLYLGALFFLLTAFWTVPYLVFREYTVTGFSMKLSSIYTLLGLIGVVAVLVFVFLQRKKRSYSGKILAFLISGLFLALLTAFDSVVNSGESKFPIPGVHTFRLEIFVILSISISLTYILQVLHPMFLELVRKLRLSKLFERKKHIAMNVAVLIIITAALLLIRINPKGVQGIELSKDMNWEGRAMRGYKVSEVLDQSRAVIDRSVIEYPENFAVDGLLKESSYLAPYYQALSKNLDKDNYSWEELDNYFVENQQISDKKTRYLMDLLWVKYIFSIRDDFPQCDVFRPVTKFETRSNEEGLIERDMYLCRYKPSMDSEFVEVLEKKPDYFYGNWSKKLDEWWLSESTDLFSDTSISTIGEDDAVFKVEFLDNHQEFKVEQDNLKSKSVVVKTSYFPNWKAYDKNGNEVQVFRISPNLLGVEITDEITFRYERSSVEVLTLLVSGLSWLGLIILIIFRKIRCKNSIEYVSRKVSRKI